MTAFQTIDFVIQEDIAKIILKRPDVLNSFNREMALELQEALDQSASSSAVRCVYLTGSGRAFSAGQDLEEAVSKEGPSIQRILEEHYNPIVKKIRALEKPVVCAVNGVAAGAGANIALACDLTYASTGASFIQAFCQIGLIPDSGGTFFLPRLVGVQRATKMMMLGEKITAEQANEWGLICGIFEENTLQESAWKIAQKLAKMPTKALGLTKMAVNASLANTLEEQLEEEVKLQTQAGTTRDFKEGTRAFLEKRKPEFIGA